MSIQRDGFDYGCTIIYKNVIKYRLKSFIRVEKYTVLKKLKWKYYKQFNFQVLSQNMGYKILFAKCNNKRFKSS